MSDSIHIATAGKGSIRLVAAITTNASIEAKKKHDLSYLTTVILSRAMSSALLLASSMKVSHARVTLRIKSEGPLKGLTVDAGRDGSVRGYVGNPKLELDPIFNKKGKYEFDFKKATGKGYLNVIRDIGKGEPFNSTIELVNGSIGEDIASYLLNSEQTPSAVFVGEKISKDQIICTGGLLIQVLPKRSTDPLLLDLIEERCKDIKSFSDKLLKFKENPLLLIKEIFPDIDYQQNSDSDFLREVQFKCPCSRERSKNALRLIGKNELEDILNKEGKAELICEFCQDKYIFNRNDILKLLNETN
tara:strand:+ start:5939 stop:6847 length:909 start_codon:yes stop_codon:yes gene_type:complete